MSCIEVAGRSDILLYTRSSVLIAFSCCMEKDDAKSMVSSQWKAIPVDVGKGECNTE